MVEKKVFEMMKKISAIVDSYSGNPVNTVGELLALKPEVQTYEADSKPLCYGTIGAIYEAIGDVWCKANKLAEAEMAYADMLKHITMMYSCDKEKHDIRLGRALHKRATFYINSVLGPVNFSAEPVELSEQKKKIYDATVRFLRDAIGCTMENAKKGIITYVDLHCQALSELMGLYFLVGNYEHAAACGADCTKLKKAVYRATHDRGHAFQLANYLNNLAAVGHKMKDPQIAIPNLEDFIEVLSEYEDVDKVGLGMMIGKAYLSLGSYYRSSRKDADLAEETLILGLSKMVEANDLCDFKYSHELVSASMLIGDFYMSDNNIDNALDFYQKAAELAEMELKRTKEQKYYTLLRQAESRIDKIT